MQRHVPAASQCPFLQISQLQTGTQENCSRNLKFGGSACYQSALQRQQPTLVSEPRSCVVLCLPASYLLVHYPTLLCRERQWGLEPGDLGEAGVPVPGNHPLVSVLHRAQRPTQSSGDQAHLTEGLMFGHWEKRALFHRQRQSPCELQGHRAARRGLVFPCDGK